MDDLDRKLINALQDGFPICESPYQQVASQFGLSEDELISRIQSLLDNGFLTRFGPMFHAEQMGGAVSLAATQVPQAHFDEIADIINDFPEVAHNYARDHALNMWFVIATDTPERIPQVINSIEMKTGLKVYNLPKIKEYYIGLKFIA